MTENKAAALGGVFLVLAIVLLSLPGSWAFLGLLPMFAALALTAPFAR